jgi:hypothetical protein
MREGEEEVLALDLGAGSPAAATRATDLEREGEEEAAGWEGEAGCACVMVGDGAAGRV